MANGGSGQEKTEGAIWPFWAIVGFAAFLLAAYLLSGGGFGGGPANLRGNRKLIPVDQRRKLPNVTIRVVRKKYGDKVKYLEPSSLKGKVVIVHFWATWCGPCMREFPEFADFVKKNANEDIVVLPISLDKGYDPVNRYLRRIDAEFPVYMDDGMLARKAGVRSIPTTLLVDEEGRIAWRQSGAVDWSKKGVPAMAQKLVGSDE